MTPAEYLNEIVLPTLREFRDERHVRRRAYLAATTVIQIAYYVENTSSRRAALHKKLASLCLDEFDALRAVANGAKHSITDPKRHRVNFAAGQDYFRPPAFAGEMVCGMSYLGDVIGGREFEHEQGRTDIYFACKRVLAGLAAEYPQHFAELDMSDC